MISIFAFPRQHSNLVVCLWSRSFLQIFQFWKVSNSWRLCPCRASATFQYVTIFRWKYNFQIEIQGHKRVIEWPFAKDPETKLTLWGLSGFWWEATVVSLSWLRRKSFNLWSLLAICWHLLSFHQTWHQDIWRDRPRPWDIKLLKSFLLPSPPFPFSSFPFFNLCFYFFKKEFFAKIKTGTFRWIILDFGHTVSLFKLDILETRRQQQQKQRQRQHLDCDKKDNDTKDNDNEENNSK